MTVQDQIAACGVVPVVEPPAGPRAAELASALVEAGLPRLEVTFRAEGAPEAIERVRSAVPAMVVGAGTVLTMAQARVAIDAGAQFLVSPGTSPAVVEFAQREGVPIIPGVTTPTEIEANLARGIEVMKLFPAEVLGGVRFLEAVFAPYRAVRFMPTGGIGPPTSPAIFGSPTSSPAAGPGSRPWRSLKPGSSPWSRSVPARRPSSSASLERLNRFLPNDDHVSVRHHLTKTSWAPMHEVASMRRSGAEMQ